MAWSIDTDYTPPDTGTTLGDIAKTVGASALSTTAGAPALGQVEAAKSGDVPGATFMGGIQRALQGTAEEWRASKTAGGKAAETDWYGHPIGYALTGLGELAPTIPMMAMGPAGMAAGFGAMNAGQTASGAASKINSYTDDELRKKAPVFDEMMKQGMDSDEARAKLLALSVSTGQMLATAGTGALAGGGLGMAIKGVGPAGSRIINAAKGFGESAVGMGAQETQQRVASDQQDIAMGSQKDVDWGTAIAQGMLTGGKWGALGMGLGAIHKSGVQVTGPTPGDVAEAGTLKAQLDNTPAGESAPPSTTPTPEVKPAPGRPADTPINRPESVPSAPSTPGGFRANPQPPPQGVTRPVVDETPPPVPAGEGHNTATQRDYGKEAVDQRKAQAGTVDQTGGPAAMDQGIEQTLKTMKLDADTQRMVDQRAALDAQVKQVQAQRPAGPQGVDDITKAAQQAMAEAQAPPPLTDAQRQAGEALRMIQEMEAKKKPAPPPPEMITDETRQMLAEHGARQLAQPWRAFPKPEELPARVTPQFEAPEFAGIPPGGRVLPDLERPPEFQPHVKQDVVPLETRAVIEEQMAGERQPNEPKAPKTVDKIRTAKQAQDAQRAEEIFMTKHPPPMEHEAPGVLRKRLAATLKEAKGRWVTIPGRIRDTTPNHLMWLKEVKDLAKAMEDGKTPIDRMKQFKADERAAIQGEWDQMRGRRVGEGARDTGTVAEEGEEKLGELPSTEPTPEEQLIEKEAGAGREDAGEPGVGPAITDDAVARRERARREGPGEAVQRKTNITPKVEAIRKRVEATGEKFAQRPEGERKPIQLKPKVVERVPVPDEGVKEPTPLTPRQQELTQDFLRANVTSEPPLPAGEEDMTPLQQVWVKQGDNPAEPTRTTLSEALNSIPADDLTAAAGGLAESIRDRIKSIAGHIPVNLTGRKQMANISGSPRANGLYMHLTNDIHLRSDMLQNRLKTAHVVMHEGVHAALTQTLYRPENAGHLANIDDLRRFVHDTLSPEERKQFAYALQYAKPEFTRVDEFLAESFSNGDFQNRLSQIKVPDVLAEKWGLPNKVTAWQALVEHIRKILGWPENHYSALEAVLQTSDPLWRAGKDIQESGHMPAWDVYGKPSSPLEDRASSAVRDPEGAISSIGDGAKYVERMTQNISDHLHATTRGRELFAKLRSLDQMAQAYAKFFKEGTLRKYADTTERMGRTADKYEADGNAIVNDMHRLQRKYEGDRGWDQLTRVMHEAQVGDFHPDKPLDDPANKHIGKDSVAGAQARAMHPGAYTRWHALPEELQGLWHRAVAHFTDTKNSIIKAQLSEILDHVGTFPSGEDKAAVLDRIFNDGMGDADRKFFSPEVFDALSRANEVKKIKGAYFPLMRRGDHVVTAEHNIIGLPAGVTKLENGDFRFTGKTARKEAMDFAARQKVPAKARGIWVDATGSTKYEDGTRVGAKDPGSVQEFHVRVESTQMEMFEKEHEAIARERELTQLANQNTILKKGSVTRQLRKNDPNFDHSISNSNVRTLIKSIEQSKDLDAATKAKVVQGLRDTSLKINAGNRLAPVGRRNVKGASDDLLRNTIDYNAATANQRARIEFQPKLDAMMNDLHDQAFKNVVPGAKDTIAKQFMVKELQQRDQTYDAQRLAMSNSPKMRAAMELTFLSKMMSPFHLITHMSHPIMISTPVLGARHGFARASIQLARAYNDMGGAGIAAAGFKGAGRIFKAGIGGSEMPSDLMGQVMRSIAKTSDGDRVNQMLEELTATGHIHVNAGWEVPRMASARTVAGRSLAWVDGWFRELTGMTETLNRVSDSVAAYRMEFEKNGGNHDAAVRYAKDNLANTQGLYSATNRAPIFQNKYTRPLLQFRQFPQMMYNLLARNLYLMVKGEDTATKIEAAKAFGGLLLTHGAMAGALGLPWEPLKVGVMLANWLGISNTTWADHERNVQASLANSLGPQTAEYLMHGFSHVMGWDAHHRMALSTLLIPFEPDSYTARDESAWLWDTVMGAPAGTAKDALAGAQDIAQGNFAKGAAKMIPSKVIADIVKAYQEAQQGASAGSVIVRGLGATPSSVSNRKAAANAYYRENRETNDARKQFGTAWQSGNKGDVIRQVNQWNSTHPNDKITLNSVASYARMLQERAQSPVGIAETRRNKERLRELERTFNTGG